MAVIAVWKCDRDDSMFADKKEAEEHDKMLELAANIAALIEENIKGIDEDSAEAIGILLSKHRENLAKACKGKPDVLLQILANVDEPKDDNVVSVSNAVTAPVATKVGS